MSSTWARARLGEREVGIADLRRLLAEYNDRGNKLHAPLFQGLLAELEAEGADDNAERALTRIDEAFALANETGEHLSDAFLHRIRGEVFEARRRAHRLGRRSIPHRHCHCATTESAKFRTASGARQGVPPRATYLFKHALVQDAAYGTLLREPRRALHARIAETLESQFAEIAERSRSCWRVTAPRLARSKRESVTGCAPAETQRHATPTSRLSRTCDVASRQLIV